MCALFQGVVWVFLLCSFSLKSWEEMPAAALGPSGPKKASGWAEPLPFRKGLASACQPHLFRDLHLVACHLRRGGVPLGRAFFVRCVAVGGLPHFLQRLAGWRVLLSDRLIPFRSRPALGIGPALLPASSMGSL